MAIAMIEKGIHNLKSNLPRSWLAGCFLKSVIDRNPWHAGFLPTGTFTLQDTPSFPRRDNAANHPREVRALAELALLGIFTSILSRSIDMISLLFFRITLIIATGQYDGSG